MPCAKSCPRAQSKPRHVTNIYLLDSGPLYTGSRFSSSIVQFTIKVDSRNSILDSRVGPKEVNRFPKIGALPKILGEIFGPGPQCETLGPIFSISEFSRTWTLVKVPLSEVQQPKTIKETKNQKGSRNPETMASLIMKMY